MAAHWLPPLLALLLVSSTALGASIPTGGNAQCSASPQDRTDCGSPGIGANECLSKGCCYNSSVPGVIRCFNPKSPSQPMAAMPPGQQPVPIPAAVQPSGIVTIGGPSGPSGTGNAQCSANPPDRTDCGFPGISENNCLFRGCCFNPSVPGVIWCFNPKGNPAYNSRCSVNPANRRDCGFPGIGENECLSRGCCYDSSIPGSIWCFSGSY